MHEGRLDHFPVPGVCRAAPQALTSQPLRSVQSRWHTAADMTWEQVNCKRLWNFDIVCEVSLQFNYKSFNILWNNLHTATIFYRFTSLQTRKIWEHLNKLCKLYIFLASKRCKMTLSTWFGNLSSGGQNVCRVTSGMLPTSWPQFNSGWVWV